MKSIAKLFCLFPLGTIIFFVYKILGLVFVFIPPVRKGFNNVADYARLPLEFTVEMYPGAYPVINGFCAFFTFPLALIAFLFGAIYAATIIGIPIAKHFFKLARLMLTPFGSLIYIET